MSNLNWVSSTFTGYCKKGSIPTAQLSCAEAGFWGHFLWKHPPWKKPCQIPW